MLILFFLKSGSQFDARQMFSTLQRFSQDFIAFLESRFIQFQMAVHVCHQGSDARRCERQYPADIGGCYKMPGGPHQVGSQDRTVCKGAVNVAFGESVCAQSDRPFSPPNNPETALHPANRQPRPVPSVCFELNADFATDKMQCLRS